MTTDIRICRIQDESTHVKPKIKNPKSADKIKQKTQKVFLPNTVYLW